MHVVVCIKQILDPEIPPREFKIDPQTNKPIRGNARLVVDSYAENALEMAIQLKERAGAKVTALCLGDKASEDSLRRAFACTVDAAVRVWDDSWTNLDGPAVAHALACSIKAIGGADLILAGRQAGDVEEGLVGPMVAEEMGLPCVTLVSDLKLESDQVQVTREANDGRDVIGMRLPALLTITSSETNVPRLPKVRDTMMARSKPIKILTAAEIGVDAQRILPGSNLERAYIPASDVACDIIPGSEGPEQAAVLASRLRDLKIL